MASRLGRHFAWLLWIRRGRFKHNARNRGGDGIIARRWGQAARRRTSSTAKSVWLPEVSQVRTVAHFALGIGSAAALLAGCTGTKALNAVPAAIEPRALPHQRTFHYTGRKQKFTVRPRSTRLPSSHSGRRRRRLPWSWPRPRRAHLRRHSGSARRDLICVRRRSRLFRYGC